MADRSFGVREINIVGSAGTPTISSPNNINLNGINVAISTDLQVGRDLSVVGISTFQDDINLGDDDKINLGDNEDLKIWHAANGTGIIQNAGSGQLQLRSDEIRLLNQATDEDYAFFRDDGAVELYCDNTKRFETTLSGAIVTGILTATSFVGDGSGLTNLPGGGGGGISTTGTSVFNNISVSGVVTATTFRGEGGVTRWTLGANGSSDYTFTGIGFTQTTNDPDLHLVRGQTYEFDNQSGGSHPFEIRTTGGQTYNHGVTNNGASSGIIKFQVPYNAPTSLVYICTSHGGMVGNIYIDDNTVGGSGGATQNFTGIVTATSFQGNSTTGDGSDRGFTTKYYITANGASSYRFAGPGVLNTTDDPTLYFHRGFTYILENSTGSGHPFALRVSAGGAAYNPGGSFLTGSQNGTQILTVPFDAPGSIVYQCTLHGGMVGTIVFVT